MVFGMAQHLSKMIILGLAACAAGAQKRGEQALRRSRGGLSSKNHVIVDGLGNPLRFRLTAGQAHDITQAQSLIEGLVFERVIAAQDFVDKVPEQVRDGHSPSSTRQSAA